MSRLTIRPLDISYWDDKIVLPSPSDAPAGYRFLFTHSEPDARTILGAVRTETVTSHDGRQHSVGGTPTHWHQHYSEYDVYQRGSPPPPAPTEVHQGLVVTTSLITSGYRIPDDYTDIDTHRAPHCSGCAGSMRFVCRYADDGRTILIDGLSDLYSHMIVLSFYVRK
jgi:hypothetical protein